MSSPALAVGKVNIVARDSIAPDPAQPRTSFDQVSLKQLAESIKARGVLQPIQVRKEGKKLLIVDGERRWRAAKLAKISKVPVLLVEAAKDTVQTRLDQIAVNNLREPLPPMDLARMLVRFRDDEKLSDNEIAARLDKDGIPWEGKKALADLMALVTLPDWAQEMIDAGELTPEAAKPLQVVAKDKKVLDKAKPAMRRRADMAGRLTEDDVFWSIKTTLQDLGTDLKRTATWYSDPVLFNPTTVCRGCEHRRQLQGSDFCLNRKHFDEMQAQAKEAGLLPGGKKPPKEKPPEERAAETAAVDESKAARKVELRGEKLRDYLEAWLRIRLVADDRVVPFHLHLVHWLAAGAPEAGTVGAVQLAPPGFREAGAVATAIGRRDLQAFLSKPLEARDYAALARLAIETMPRHCLQTLAIHIGFKMAEEYRIDADYLALCKKPQLVELAEKTGLVDYRALGMPALREEILKDQAIVDRVGVPGELMAVYSGPMYQSHWNRPLDQDDEDDDGSEMTCIGCGCTDSHGCDGGCSWVEEDLDEMVGLCSSCEEAHYERWLAGVRTPPGKEEPGPEAEDQEEAA